MVTRAWEISQAYEVIQGVLLQSDYITYADTLDCLIYFSFFPHTVAHVRYDLMASFVLSCTISILELPMYDTI